MFKQTWFLQTGCLAFVLAFTQATLQAQTAEVPSSQVPPVKKQLPADRRAFRAAMIIDDPDQSIAALRAFLKQYPKSSRVGYAQSAIFKLLINNFPQRTSEIEAEVKLQVKEAGKGESRTSKQIFLAWSLAEVGTAGLDLPLAEKLATDAVKHSTEAEFDKQTLASYAKFKVPAPKPAELHRRFAESRA